MACAVIGCGGSSEPVCESCGAAGSGATQGGTGGSGGTLPVTAPPPDGPFPSAADAAAACSEPGQVVDVFDAASIGAWLERRWYFCSGSPIFLEPHAGLEIASDGRWYFLDLVDGELVRRDGFDGGGDWSLVENPGNDRAHSVQVNLDRFSGGGVGGYVRFAVSPLKVNLSTGGAGPSEYVGVSSP